MEIIMSSQVTYSYTDPESNQKESNHLVLKFIAKAVPNQRLSRKEGRPIYEEKEFLWIKKANDKHYELCVPADSPSTISKLDNLSDGMYNDDDDMYFENGGVDNIRYTGLLYKEIYAKEYNNFLAKKSEKSFVGTPLEELTFLSIVDRANIKACKIRSAEQLAEADDHLIMSIGAMDLKRKTQAWLKKAKSSSIITDLASENLDLKSQLSIMQEQIELLRNSISASKEDAKVNTRKKKKENELLDDNTPQTVIDNPYISSVHNEESESE